MRILKQDDQRGMVSITVTVVIIALVSLITLGFATLVRRDQRQALDRQLSTQAYYAAESGINDAIEWLRLGGSGEISDCGTSKATFSDNVLSTADDSIQYSCLLIDRSPDKLSFDPVGTDKGVVFPVNSNDGAVDKISFSWQSTDGYGNTFLDSSIDRHNLLSDSQWDTFAGVTTGRTSILRVDIIPVNDVSRAALTANTRTFFLYPKGDTDTTVGTTNVVYGSKAAQQIFIDGQCSTASTPQYCNASVSGLPGGDFYVRMKAIYAPASVTVRGYNSANQPLELADAQALIDVTGKASDVLRRLQVTVPLTREYDFPEYAIETTDTICKLLSVYPAGPGNPVGGTDTDPIPNNFVPTVDTVPNQNACNPLILN